MVLPARQTQGQTTTRGPKQWRDKEDRTSHQRYLGHPIPISKNVPLNTLKEEQEDVRKTNLLNHNFHFISSKSHGYVCIGIWYFSMLQVMPIVFCSFFFLLKKKEKKMMGYW